MPARALLRYQHGYPPGIPPRDMGPQNAPVLEHALGLDKGAGNLHEVAVLLADRIQPWGGGGLAALEPPTQLGGPLCEPPPEGEDPVAQAHEKLRLAARREPPRDREGSNDPPEVAEASVASRHVDDDERLDLL